LLILCQTIFEKNKLRVSLSPSRPLTKTIWERQKLRKVCRRRFRRWLSCMVLFFGDRWSFSFGFYRWSTSRLSGRVIIGVILLWSITNDPASFAAYLRVPFIWNIDHDGNETDSFWPRMAWLE